MPSLFMCHDERGEGYIIEVELPGVSKRNIELSFSERGFCIRGERPDFIYDGCFPLAHEVDVEGVKAKFEHGLLRIYAPFKEAAKFKKVAVK